MRVGTRVPIRHPLASPVAAFLRAGQRLSENMRQDQRRLTISRGCCGLCLGMELFSWRMAALPSNNGVPLGMDLSVKWRLPSCGLNLINIFRQALFAHDRLPVPVVCRR